MSSSSFSAAVHGKHFYLWSFHRDYKELYFGPVMLEKKDNYSMNLVKSNVHRMI